METYIDEEEFECENFILKDKMTDEEIRSIMWKTGWALSENYYLRHPEENYVFDSETIEKMNILDKAIKNQD